MGGKRKTSPVTLVLLVVVVVGIGVALYLFGAQSADISRQGQDLLNQTRSALP